MSAKVAVLVGSLRKGAFSRAVAEALVELAGEELDLGIVEIGDLPLYNPDLDGPDPDGAEVPAPWAQVRRALGAAEAVLFVTPEYNRSMPAVMKNVLDVGSRPYGQGVWDGKPAGVVSVSAGAMGGFGANHHLRQVLVTLNMPVLQQPEMYLARVGDAVEEGRLTNDKTRDFLLKFLDAFAAWVTKTAR